jgi:hypothetical protein
MQIRIFVLDRGFVLVGRCENFTGMGMWVPLHDCRCIRRWGTTQGLAELATKGPTRETHMDAVAPMVTVPVRAVIQVLEVEQSKWESHLATK